MKRVRGNLEIVALIAVLCVLFVATVGALWALNNYTMISPNPILVLN